MQTITKYRADDGTEHTTEDECRRWENAIRNAAVALSPLGQDRDIRHGRYIQHELVDINRARSNLLRELRLFYPSWPWEKWGNDDSQYHPRGIIGRFVDDSNSPYRDAWFRLMCISFTTGREYDQPYFASNEGESEGPM